MRQPEICLNKTAPKTKRPRGRPRKKPPWLDEVAHLYAQGFPSRSALCKVGEDNLSTAERKGIYRSKRFRQLVARYREQYGIWRRAFSATQRARFARSREQGSYEVFWPRTKV